jgi:hypothetical protein
MTTQAPTQLAAETPGADEERRPAAVGTVTERPEWIRQRLYLYRPLVDSFLPKSSFNSADYYTELINWTTKPELLPLIRLKASRTRLQQYRICGDDLQLFDLSLPAGGVTAKDLTSDDGLAICFDLVWRLEINHLQTKIRHNITEIITSGTAAEDKLKELSECLVAYG